MSEIVPASLRERVRARLRAFAADDVAGRLWAQDATLWKSDPGHRATIERSLGWLDVAEQVRDSLPELLGFAAEVSAEGYREAVLLGMGGSSLAAEVLSSAFGAAAGYLKLTVLDTTDPRAVAAADSRLDPQTTLFVVASKSGGTTETASLHAYFFERLRAAGDSVHAGRHFIAITDEGTVLQRQAVEQDFRAVFVNPSDIGGRYSALSFFGMVPAALGGMDLAELLGRAVVAAEDCGPAMSAAENPGLVLGAALGESALAGRDKLTVLASPGIASFGAWVEQLVAESTGKEGSGILPVDAEPLGSPDAYGDDRVFVYLRLNDAPDAAQDAQVAALEAAGIPVLHLEMADAFDLGRQFFIWEVAVAVAGAVLGVNPFDQPNVQESKENTRRVLADLAASEEVATPRAADGGQSVFAVDDAALVPALAAVVAAVSPPSYVAFQAWVTPSPAAWAELTTLRQMVRDRRHVATTLGYGPRFLHSTGQYHKGGSVGGVFLQLVARSEDDLPVPGVDYGFRRLIHAQALGDMQALAARGRRVLRVELGADPVAGLRRLIPLVQTALGG
jgi:glucose-6-phosphate isomerase